MANDSGPARCRNASRQALPRAVRAWAARYPEQVPQINGEYEYLAAFTPEVRE